MKTPLLTILAATGGALLLAACEPAAPETPVMRSGSAADESACLAAVKAQANNSVVVLSSDFSQAATEVMVGVGPDKAPWRCLVSNGQVTEVMSTVNEGAL